MIPLVAELWNVLSMWFMIPMVSLMAWTMLLLWPKRWDGSMVWNMCLSMLVSMMHLRLLLNQCLLPGHIYGPLDVVSRYL
jgi:hypothetical protein